MKPILSAILLTFLAIALSLPATAEKVRCSAIRDSAMCLAEPSCWYDAANGKGCLDGPRPDENACAVHGSESTCNTSSLGCTWSAGACVTKKE